MSERVHPSADSPPPSGTNNSSENSSFLPKPQPPPGTYVIQVPKDQIYRIPPPENARRYKNGRKIRRNRCCCCLCWLLAAVAILLVAVAAAVGIFYLVVRPKSPNYSVKSLSVRGFNLTSFQTSLTLSPEFDVTVRAENPNKKIGIYYVGGSTATVSYADVALCNGVLPTFYQGSRNVTVFQTALTGEVIRLSASLADSLTAQQRKGEIPLALYLRVPVKIKVGAVKTWKITVKVRCDLTVDKLAEGSKIVSSSCKVKVHL